jgi:uncharacterized membrane protein
MPLLFLARAAAVTCCVVAAAPRAHPPSHLGGVNLNHATLLGTEPFWSVDITAGWLVLKRPDGAALRARNPGAVIRGGTATWRARGTDGQAVTLTARVHTCSDGMSDIDYPLIATVRWGDLQLKGCGEATGR